MFVIKNINIFLRIIQKVYNTKAIIKAIPGNSLFILGNPRLRNQYEFKGSFNMGQRRYCFINVTTTM
jgi:hypothetical protein